MENIIEQLNKIVWGPATLVIFLGTGLFLLIRLKCLPWRRLKKALGLAFIPDKSGKTNKEEGDISPFQSLMTALGACMGTGNIVGVASAMVLGGPGALIWMCLSSLIGLPTIFCECVLGVMYREKNKAGEMCGGPMYVMEKGIGGKIGKTMAVLFALFTVGASFGIGNMTQTNSVAEALSSIWNTPTPVTGIIIAITLLIVLLGGIKSIGKVCSLCVPVASILYIGCALVVIGLNYKNIVPGLREMIHMAFSFKAVSGGLGGTITASMFTALKWGVARGVFSNEAGLGSAPIAAAAAKTDSAVKQGYIHMTGAFVDTVIMCTITGLAIMASGVLGVQEQGVTVSGVGLTMKAFETVLGKMGSHVIGISMIVFAFPTLLGWAYYGEKALEYLVQSKSYITMYRVLFSLACFTGAVCHLGIIWGFSDIMNGFMAIPNLICILVMHSKVVKTSNLYERRK